MKGASSAWNHNQTEIMIMMDDVDQMSMRWKIDEGNFKMISLIERLFILNGEKMWKTKIMPSQHKICRRNIRHQKFLFKTSEVSSVFYPNLQLPSMLLSRSTRESPQPKVCISSKNNKHQRVRSLKFLTLTPLLFGLIYSDSETF